MSTQIHRTAELGEVVAAAFDEAARWTTAPREVSRLATQVVAHVLRRARRTSISLPARTARATAAEH